MNILYAIQGTGNGHISRARELLPELSKQAVVDVMVTGYSGMPDLNEPIKYQKYGISLTYDSNGGVSVFDTMRNFRPIRFLKDVRSIPLQKYDLVISDFEPVSAWSAKLDQIPCVGLSHQAAFLSEKTPRPFNKSSLVAETLLQHFAPSDDAIGFHFRRYDDFIEPPIIRSAIRELQTKQKNHITVYLPAYHHQRLMNIFAPFVQVDWHIFSPVCIQQIQKNNFWVHPVGHRPFLDSLATCQGVICSAGFETCAEAMYLGKKLLAVPIRNQYEQQCNAAALQQLGVVTLETLDNHSQELWHWLEHTATVTIDEIAEPEDITAMILDENSTGSRFYKRLPKIAH